MDKLLSVRESSKPVSTAKVIVPTKDGVGGCQYGGTTVKYRGNAGLGNANRLLFHGFVNGNAIRATHLVKLVWIVIEKQG